MTKYILWLVAALLVMVPLIAACSDDGGTTQRPIRTTAPTPTRTPTPSPTAPPNPPSSLGSEALSQSQVNLWWTDNSHNEEGFRIYRDGVLVTAVGSNVTACQDTGLEAATPYAYVVKSYNDAGESYPSSCTATTSNPGIAVTIDKIGVVYPNEWYLAYPGEIYVYVVISDGKTEPRVTRIPSTGAIELNEYETKIVRREVFSTHTVGDDLKIVAIAMESDPAIHGAIRNLLVGALVSYVTGGAGMGLLGSLLQGVISGEEAMTELAECPEDDFVGAIERAWTLRERWGVGSYTDIRDEDFRLWFTIEELP